MRSTWKGSIGFGLVSIPIKLYPAVEDKAQEVRTHNYHLVCGSRIQQPKWCEKCGHIVQKEELVSGYELDEAHYVPITDGERNSLKLKSLRSLQVVGFVKGDFDDPRWISDHYFISPEEVGAKPFVLFVQAMEALGVVGITKVTLKTKEQLAAVRPFKGILLLHTLHWGDELRDYDELLVSASVSDKEMEMAKQLIGAMTGEIDLCSFKDEYRKAFGELIAAKLSGQTIELPTEEKKVEADLFESLMASLEAVEPVKA